jgi:hypothetical protein
MTFSEAPKYLEAPSLSNPPAKLLGLEFKLYHYPPVDRELYGAFEGEARRR